MVKKLTSEGLRRLIVTEVKRIREGGPGQDFDDDDELSQEIAGHAGEKFKDAHPYDADSDSGELGEGAWEQQLESAAQAVTDDLIEPVQRVIKDVAERLINGEFYVENPRRGRAGFR